MAPVWHIIEVDFVNISLIICRLRLLWGLHYKLPVAQVGWTVGSCLAAVSLALGVVQGCAAVGVLGGVVVAAHVDRAAAGELL